MLGQYASRWPAISAVPPAPVRPPTRARGPRIDDVSALPRIRLGDRAGPRDGGVSPRGAACGLRERNRGRTRARDALDWRGATAPSPIDLDGSVGEGGGQILRTALSLSAVTGRPFSIDRVRPTALKPGLRPQHREAARAVAAPRRRPSSTATRSAPPSSSSAPPPGRAPATRPSTSGTAGSTPLLFQTVCWPLALAGAPSALTLRGGTHQDHAPSFHYLALVWAPAVARLGFRFALELPGGGVLPGGRRRVHRPHRAGPARSRRSTSRHRGTLLEVEVVSMVGGLGYEVAERQAARALRRLRELGISAEAERVPVPARALDAAATCSSSSSFERTRAGHGAVTRPRALARGDGGPRRRGLRAPPRGRGGGGPPARRPAPPPRGAGGCPGHPASPAGVAPSVRYSVSEVTCTSLTNAEVIRRFLDVEVAVEGRDGRGGRGADRAPGLPGRGLAAERPRVRPRAQEGPAPSHSQRCLRKNRYSSTGSATIAADHHRDRHLVRDDLQVHPEEAGHEVERQEDGGDEGEPRHHRREPVVDVREVGVLCRGQEVALGVHLLGEPHRVVHHVAEVDRGLPLHHAGARAAPGWRRPRAAAPAACAAPTAGAGPG